jgi:nitroreductase
MLDLFTAFRWRYACKVFDPTKKIAESDFQKLLDALVLSASSYGLQPWKFLVINNPEIRIELRKHSWNQGQITDASHLIVLCRRNAMDAEYVQRFIQDMSQKQGTSLEKLEGYKQLIMGHLVPDGQKKDQPIWAANQVYIALANLMSAAAVLEIDTAPIEGFKPAKYNEILNLSEQGFHAQVVCPVGYRAENDWNKDTPKVRFDQDDLVTVIE